MWTPTFTPRAKQAKYEQTAQLSYYVRETDTREWFNTQYLTITKLNTYCVILCDY